MRQQYFSGFPPQTPTISNMAAGVHEETRKATRVDYNALNNLSSVVLYPEVKRLKRKTYPCHFAVERIIERRRMTRNVKDHEYLIKWQGWPLESSSWEPSAHLTPELIRTYEKPTCPNRERLQQASSNFYSAIISYLKGNSFATFYAIVDLDIWRYVTYNRGSNFQHKGYKLCKREDLELFHYLPSHWWYYLDQHGEGRAIRFPIKIKPVLSWTPSHYILQNYKLVPAPRIPVEKLAIGMVKRAYTVHNL